MNAFTYTSADAADAVTAADIDSGLDTDALTAAGIHVVGTAAAGTLEFQRLDGRQIDVVVSSDFGTAAGSFANFDATVEGAAVTTTTVGALTLKVGTGTAVDLAGDYSSAQEFVERINSIGNVYASIDSETGFMSLSSPVELEIGAGAGATALGLTSGTVAVSGSLTTVDITSVDNANDAIQRVDSALTSVSTLRSTLGAIQNRFQSVINSLQGVSENLSASRSRILDTDFASETAALTRAQILQQAGTAMVAQANQVPQNVLSLLR